MTKNLRIYRLQDFDLSEQELAEKLSNIKARDPSGLDMKATGWGSPFGKKSDELVHSTMGFHRISLITTQRLLTKPAVDCQVEDKVCEFIEKEKREPEPSELRSIRKKTREEMIPKAFCRRVAVDAVIDRDKGFLYVFVSSAKKADDFTSTLRKCLGSLKAYPLETKFAPQPIMTGWLTDGDLPKEIQPGAKCTLIDLVSDSGEKSPEIKFNHSDAGNNDVARLLAEGMRISELSMVWNDAFSMTIKSNLVVTGIKATLFTLEKVSGEAEEVDARAQADATLCIYGSYFRELAEQMIEWFGGEADYAKLAEERHGIKDKSPTDSETEAGESESEEKAGKTGKKEAQDDMFFESGEEEKSKALVA